jgi:hypothetical protein
MSLCFATLFILVLLVGCAGLPEAQTQRIGNRQLEFVAHLRTGPVVVFGNGLGGQMEWRHKMLPAIANDTTYPLEKPEAVVDAIRSALAEIRTLN